MTTHAKRVAAGDVDALADMAGLATELDEAIAQAVIGLREAGYSWAEIAARLGVTPQAAQQRWGRS
jgi:predicted transcriptional regulator